MSVIDFQKAKEKLEQKKFDQIVEEAQNEDEFISDLSANAVLDIVDVLCELGYDVEDNPACVKDILLVSEAIKALMYRIRGVEFPMQKVSDACFPIDEVEKALQIVLELGDERD